MVNTLKEAEDRIRNAMKPPQMKRGNNFSPGIQNMRQTASSRRPQRIGRKLPIAR